MPSEKERSGSAGGVRRVSPDEAKSLLDLGYFYVDVRTVEEFHALHPVGALNVPIPPAATPSAVPTANSAFVGTMERLFSRDAKIVVGCATGVRSLRAAELLVTAGFTDVVEQRAGIEGVRGAFGNLVEPGWAEAGFPVTSGRDAGSFESLESLDRQGEAVAARARS
ncbi:MAG: rhodanese-like domain-containing protein [Polyangiaceae bacterium]